MTQFPEDFWVYLSSSICIDTDTYLGIIVIFCFKSYYQISLLAANISWLLVPPIFIKCDRTVILPVRMWNDIPSFSNIVNNIIANLAALSHETFMWDFRFSMDHVPFAVWPWQLALQFFNNTSRLVIISSEEEMKGLPLQRVKFFFHLNRSLLASTEIITFPRNSCDELISDNSYAVNRHKQVVRVKLFRICLFTYVCIMVKNPFL